APVPVYYVVLGAAGAMYGLLLWLERSPLGTALRAVRDNEQRTSYFGFDVSVYKTLSLALSGGVAGFAGGLFVTQFGFVSPGLSGRRKVEACMAEIGKLGDTLLAHRPDALIVVADDHLNAFSFNAVPAICVRIGRDVNRMIQDEAEAFDKVLDGMPERYALHE